MAQGVDFDKVVAEADILRGFIDFVNRQVGVYMDCLSGFEGNSVRIHRQTARILRRSGIKVKDGQKVMVAASIEDPTLPDVIHHRIIRAADFIATNSPCGFNEQQICWSIIVFLFAYWDEEIRPQIARVRGVEPNDVQVEALGDLRILRKSIIHEGGRVSPGDYAKLKLMSDLVKPSEPITLTHDQMHKLFVIVKQAIAQLLMTYSAHLPGAPDPTTITDVAIQNASPRRPGR